jgi:hypothetical protein
LFRYASDVYGQTVLVGASWDLIWWFVGAGAAFIVLHALVSSVAHRRARYRSAGG